MYRQNIRDVPTKNHETKQFIIHDFVELILKMGIKLLYVKKHTSVDVLTCLSVSIMIGTLAIS